MHYLVTCRDVDDSAQLRQAALSDHRQYVDAQAQLIVLSGPLVDDDGERRLGQLFIVDVPDREAASAFVSMDPFSAAGVFASVQVARLRLRFENGARITSAG